MTGVNIIRGRNQIYILTIIIALISCTHSRNSTLTQSDNNSEDEFKGTYLVEQITDQDLLIDIAQTDKSAKVRKDAVERITNQDVLIKVAQTDKSGQVRKAAVERITNQDVLIEVVQTDRSGQARKAAVERITDQDFLIEVAQTDHSYAVQLAAARTIQYLLDRNQYTDYKNIKKDVAKLMLFLLDPPIIERHGLIKLDIKTEVVEKSFDPSGRYIGSATNYSIKIKALSGKTILERRFIAPPPVNSETTEHRVATIDYDRIMILLWFLASSE
jgi:hypothetical protein